MSLPEGYRPREGDVLLVRGIVAYNVEPGDPSVHVKIEGSYSGKAIVTLDKVYALARRRWEPNEKVRIPVRGMTEPGEVIGTFQDHVWVQHPKYVAPMTYQANELQEWIDPKAALVRDEEALRREDTVAEAMQEPAPVEPPSVLQHDENCDAAEDDVRFGKDNPF